MKNLLHKTLYTKKIKTIFLITIIIFVLLVTRLAVIQFVDGAYLKEKHILNKQ